MCAFTSQLHRVGVQNCAWAGAGSPFRVMLGWLLFPCRVCLLQWIHRTLIPGYVLFAIGPCHRLWMVPVEQLTSWCGLQWAQCRGLTASVAGFLFMPARAGCTSRGGRHVIFFAYFRRPSKRAAVCAVVLALASGLSSTGACANSVKHYYIEIGGTGSVEPAQCTRNFGFANQALAGNPSAVVVQVCYPASAGPFQAGNGTIPGFGAASYDDSVRQGYDNLLATVESTYNTDPDARYTIVGYSQGAQAADEVLQTIAEHRTGIPTSSVEGKLYADPRQPGTGSWSVVPQGWGAFGFTSTGPGPVDFAGIPVARYCIHTDLACDATSLISIPGLLTQHPRYLREGGIAFATLAVDGQNGNFWYPPNS